MYLLDGTKNQDWWGRLVRLRYTGWICLKVLTTTGERWFHGYVHNGNPNSGPDISGKWTPCNGASPNKICGVERLDCYYVGDNGCTFVPFEDSQSDQLVQLTLAEVAE